MDKGNQRDVNLLPDWWLTPTVAILNIVNTLKRKKSVV